MTLARINPTAIVADVFGQDRVTRIQAELKAQRAASRSAPRDTIDARTAERNIHDLEALLERAEENARIGAERAQAIQARREEQVTAAAEQAQAEIEAELRRRYDRAMPKPVTDAEWDLVRDSVLHKHRLSQMDRHEEAVAAARRSGRYSL